MNPQKWTTPQQTRRIAVEQYQKYDAALKGLQELQDLDSARSPSARVAGTLPPDRPASTSLSRPALTGHQVLSQHAALAGTFAVCPPEWDLSPSEYETALRLRTGEENATVEATRAASPTLSPDTSSDPSERRRRWTLLLDRFEDVNKQWADLLTDPLAVLEHARLLDVSHPPTAAFIEAHGHARDLIGSRTRTSPDSDLPPVETLREIETAVRAMATAWTDAQTHAQRAGYAWLPDADRKRARQATILLTQAADTTLGVQATITLTEKALELLRAIETVPIPQPVLRALGQATAPALGPVLGPSRTAAQS